MGVNMKISTKGKYGMHMMHYLAKNKDATPIPLTFMANELDLPEAYLEQLMRKLKKANYVNSVRGAHGGYSLSKPAKDILIIDILETLEDGIRTSECTEIDYDGCENYETCPNRIIWKKVDNAVFEALSNYSLQDLLDEEEALIQEVYQ